MRQARIRAGYRRHPGLHYIAIDGLLVGQSVIRGNLGAGCSCPDAIEEAIRSTNKAIDELEAIRSRLCSMASECID